MSVVKYLSSGLLLLSILCAPVALSAGKTSKGRASPSDSVSGTFTATVGERSLLQGPANSTINVPLLPGGKIDVNGTLVKDLGAISFSTNDPDMLSITFSITAPAQLTRTGGGTLDYKLSFDDDGSCSNNSADYFAPGSVPDRLMSLVAMSGQIHVCAIITGPLNSVILKGDYTGTFMASAFFP